MPARTVLIVAEPFGMRSRATLVAAAIGRGMRARDPSLDTDLCPLDEPCPPDGPCPPDEPCPLDEPVPGGNELSPGNGPAALRVRLAALDLDMRLRRAGAVVIAAARLDHHMLLGGGAVFEIATRARQNGVPAFAITGHAGLDLFEARILDLQVVLKARGERALAAAGGTLAAALDLIQ